MSGPTTRDDVRAICGFARNLIAAYERRAETEENATLSEQGAIASLYYAIEARTRLAEGRVSP